jgi:TRAP-type C4-dicarboxylate transport system permease small subunit
MMSGGGERPRILARNVFKAIAFFAIALLGLGSLGLCPTLLLADVVMSVMPPSAQIDEVANLILVIFILTLSGFLLWYAVKIARGQ